MSTRALPEPKSASAVVSPPAPRSGRTSSRFVLGASGDRAEQEADRIAALALSGPARLDVGAAPFSVQRSPSVPSPSQERVPSSVDRAVAAPGRPLSDAVRRHMEPRFGHDFSQVRVHADAQVAMSAREVRAQAYTVGDDIVFAPGRFAESTPEGRRLIAHELTHVVQQRGGAAVVQRAPDTDVAESNAQERDLTDGDAQVVEPAADGAEPLASGIKIDRLNVITSSKGAFSGFPIVDGLDLNKPGAFNDTTTTGSCVNIHQMQFHLAKGDPKEVKLIRQVVRVSSAGGKTSNKGEKDKPAGDGPSSETVVRPKDSRDVVVSDCPGFKGKGDFKKAKGAFPVSYDADFDLFATDIVQPAILAKLQYSVKVFKKAPDDANPVNEITIKNKSLR